MKFVTQSGSAYEVDASLKRVRRLFGSNDSTERQGKDGAWRDYVAISPIEVGHEVFFVWNNTTQLLPETLELLAEGLLAGAIPGTVTSPVAKFLEET